jgi:hypothetical protein
MSTDAVPWTGRPGDPSRWCLVAPYEAPSILPLGVLVQNMTRPTSRGNHIGPYIALKICTCPGLIWKIKVVIARFASSVLSNGVGLARLPVPVGASGLSRTLNAIVSLPEPYVPRPPELPWPSFRKPAP